MDLQCYICHDRVRIPVRFTCFPCPKTNQPSCNSMIRVCIQCAKEYLQLNKAVAKRTATRKCLVCPSTIQCKDIRLLGSFEKDYLVMRFDKDDDYACFHEDKGCGFKGTQVALDHHLQQECQFREVSCKHCKKIYFFPNEEKHKARCAAQTRCKYCSEFVPIRELEDHVLTVHGLTRCKDCSIYVPTHSIKDHANKCPFHKEQCPHCKGKVLAQEFQSHLSRHIKELQVEIERYTKAVDNRVASMDVLSKKLTDFSSFFYADDILEKVANVPICEFLM